MIIRGTAAVERVFSVTQLDQRLEIVDDPDVGLVLALAPSRG